MAAIHDFQDGRHLNPNFAYKSKTKHDRRAKSMLYLGFGGQRIQWNYIFISKMAAILDFQDGHHLNLILHKTRKLIMIERQAQRQNLGF